MDYIKELLPELLFQAPDVSDTALRRALQLGAQDLFLNSDLWVQELPTLVLYSNLDRYTLRLPADTRIARVEWVKLDNEPLAPLELEDISENTRVGYHITNSQPHQLLVTDKTKRGDLKMTVRLYPTAKAKDLPEWLVLDFRTALVNSALIKVYGMPGSPWFDPQLAALLGMQVGSAIDNGKRLVANRKRGKRRLVRYGGL